MDRLLHARVETRREFISSVSVSRVPWMDSYIAKVHKRVQIKLPRFWISDNRVHLLADQLITLEVVESISHECVRQVLKKHHKTLAEADVVHTGTGQRPLRVSDGGRA